MLFGCGDEIAPFDADALATRAGELIAKVTSAKALTMVVDVSARVAGDRG
jgi:hypothetical protein